MNMARKFSVACCLLCALSILSVIVTAPLVSAQDTSAPRNTIWTTPEVGALPDNEQGRLVRRGRDLVTATYAHIGPEVPDIANRYGGRCCESDDGQRDADGRSSEQPRREKRSLIYERTQKGNEAVLIIPAERLHLRGQQMPSRDARCD